MNNNIRSQLIESADLIKKMTLDEKLINNINLCTSIIIDALKNGGKVITAGNGGSASDSQHFVAELISKYNFDRPGLNAVALDINGSVMTAISNDYGYENLFKRQLETVGKKGDVFIAYSTSGDSKNILNALETAKNDIGIHCIGMSGNRKSKMRYLCDHLIEIPSNETPKIQEGHAIVNHIICSLIEKVIFQSSN